MKKLITLCLFILVAFAVNAQTKNYYKNGKLKEIGYLDTKGKKTGEWKAYHENGKLSAIGLFDQGKPIGEWKVYHETGKLGVIGKYENGKETGEWKAYHENGKLDEIGHFEKGEKTGEWKSYYESGKLKDIGKYKNGEEIGEWIRYDDKGNSLNSENDDEQHDFKNEKLKLVSDIFYKTTKQNINSFMKDKGFEKGTVEKGPNGDVLNFYSKFNVVDVEYAKDNKILNIFCIFSGAINATFVDLELMGSGYISKNIKFTDEDGSEKERKIWTKLGAKYSFISYPDEKEKVGMLSYGIFKE